MSNFDGRLLNGAALAYLGDATYEVAVRRHLLEQEQTRPNDLHRLATNYVSATAQAYLIDEMEAAEFLSDEEASYFKRGRNSQTYTKAKNADHATYSRATGFEALIGHLYLNDEERCLELINLSIKFIEKEGQ